MRRTSSKAFVIGYVLFLCGVISLAAAEIYARRVTTNITFDGDPARPWNFLDYVVMPSLVLSAAFFVVGMMFANKND
jgi:hypothetical protein